MNQTGSFKITHLLRGQCFHCQEIHTETVHHVYQTPRFPFSACILESTQSGQHKGQPTILKSVATTTGSFFLDEPDQDGLTWHTN